MKLYRIYFIIICVFLPSIIYSQEKRSGLSLSIMTYNIRNGIGIDDITDYQRTANAIKEYNPDIVAIQEVDSVTSRSNKRFVIADIASITEMYYVFAPAINFDGGKYGIGILSKEKPLNTYYLPLPGREEGRTFVVAEFKDFIFICTHLSLTAEDQEASIDIINKEVKQMQKPVFVAGDFNADLDSKTIQLFKNKFEILSPEGAKTYPADNPTESIDYIAIHKTGSGYYNLEKSFVADQPLASDHRPVCVEVSTINK